MHCPSRPGQDSRGRTITFKVREGETAPHAIHYPLDEDNTVKVTGWRGLDGAICITYDGPRPFEFSVETTLWGAAANAGLRAGDIANIAGVFGSIDFTELQAGAKVKMVIEELYHEGFRQARPPLAVRLENKGEAYLAIHHFGGGDTGYFDDKGWPARRPSCGLLCHSRA